MASSPWAHGPGGRNNRTRGWPEGPLRGLAARGGGPPAFDPLAAAVAGGCPAAVPWRWARSSAVEQWTFNPLVQGSNPCGPNESLDPGRPDPHRFSVALVGARAAACRPERGGANTAVPALEGARRRSGWLPFRAPSVPRRPRSPSSVSPGDDRSRSAEWLGPPEGGGDGEGRRKRRLVFANILDRRSLPRERDEG